MAKLKWAALALILAGLGVALLMKPGPKQSPRPAAEAPTAGADVPPARLPPGAVPLFAPRADFRFAIFHLPEPTTPVMAKLDELRSGAFKQLPVVSEPKDGDPLPYLSVQVLPRTRYPLPTSPFDSARKLSPDVRSRLHTSRQVTVIEVHTAPPALGPLRQAHALVAELAEATGGVIWDEQSSELFEPSTWRAQRLSGWSGSVPVVFRHIAVGARREGQPQRVRLVTEGMAKLGLPDVEIKQVPLHLVRQMTGVVNIAVQVLLETGGLPKEGELPVDVDALGHAGLREGVLRTLAQDSKRKVKLTVVSIHPPQKPIRDNRLMELACAGEGKVPSEQQESLLAELYGASRTGPVDRDEEMLALSRLQVEKLKRDVKPRFLKGLGELELLRVRAPFKTSSGDTEWPWVVVERWEGNTLHGILHDWPRDVPQLRAGSPVSVQVDDVFDYLIEGPDGRKEGNETTLLKSKRWAKQPD